MTKRFLISVSIDERPEIQCLPLGLNDPGLGLGFDGIAGCDQSEALLYVDEHHELMIRSIGQAHVVIERGGRRIDLPPKHPIRILTKDTVIIGRTEPHTFNIRHIYSTRKTPTSISSISKMTMIACAASMMMVCPACNHPTPNNATQTTETPESQACDLTEEDMQLMRPNTTMGIVDPDTVEMMKLMKDKSDFVDEMKSNLEE